MEEHPYDFARREMIPFIPNDASHVLDVGCSTGRFCSVLKSQLPHAEIWGIEPHKEAADNAGKRADRIIHGLYPDEMPKNCPEFDAIFFNDVLEHLVDPWEVLNETHHHLSSTGRVIASIPNIRHWTVLKSLVWSGSFEYTTAGIMDNTHLRFFTRSTMMRMFHDCDYVVQKCAPINNDNYWKARVLSWILPSGCEILAHQFALVAASRE